MTSKNLFIKHLFAIVGMVCFLLQFEGLGQNLNIKTYYNESTFRTVDGSVLDNVFATVTGDGSTRTDDWISPTHISSLPTTVTGFAGYDVVMIMSRDGSISLAQATAIISYVTNGGILICDMEGTSVSSTSSYASAYIASALLCNSVTVTQTASGAPGITPAPAYHPGNGCLLLNSSGATSIHTSETFSLLGNVPPENCVMLGLSAAITPCSSVQVLDIVVPEFPGQEIGSNTCGIQGFAILSGELFGPLSASDGTSTVLRNNSQLNTNYAQLIYDFLYNSTALRSRYTWAENSSNTNSTCAPQPFPCRAVAPLLAPSTLSNTCPNDSTANLNSVTASNLQTSTLTWHSATPATSGNLIATPTSVPAGTYYAAFDDSANGCLDYSYGQTSSISVTIETCCAAGNEKPMLIKN